jgi:glucose/mannose-6-phosphate isomerase
LIDLSLLKKIDSQGMHKVYDVWPKIAKESYFSNLSQIEYEKCSHIVFAGMGGSGAIGDIFSAILSKTSTHVTVVKGYHLPKTVTSDSVVVISSISGNTIETISMLESAIKLNSKIIVFSDGGKIKEICNEKNIPHRNIKKYHSPRTSFTSFLYAMLHVLKPIIPIAENDIIESIEKMEEISIKINSKNITKENPSIQMAEWIENTPVIYYPWGLEPVAIRFKNSLQENCKNQAVIEDVIESCHNGIVTWDKKNNFQPILIRGQEDYEKTKERWEILKEFFNEKNIEFKEIVSEEGNILTKIICLIYLLDYASIYHAIKLGIDPTPVEAIEYVKRKLNSS